MKVFRLSARFALLVGCLWLALQASATADSQLPPTGRWLSSSFSGPEDGQLWHSVFYVVAVERPQLITRHSGLMIRCTAAPVSDNLKVAFAFGAVLRTNSRGEIGVDTHLDGRPYERLQLVTRNQANAEFVTQGAKRFLLRLLDANTLQFSARLSPKGSSRIAMPLAVGKGQITKALADCGIDLAAEVEREARLQVAKSRSSEATQRMETPDQNVRRLPLTNAVASYLAANDAAELAAASAAIVRLQPSVNAVIAAIQAPDAVLLSPAAQAALPGRGEAGVSSREVDGLRLPFHVVVPAGEPAAAGMPLALVLHGGVQRPPWGKRERWWRDYPFNPLLRDFLVVSPAAWRDAHWWSGTQQKNLAELIAQMQRHYRVDKSRIFVIGVSDGGAGAMLLAMTNATPLAGAASLIGHPGVLFEPRINAGPEPQFANLSQLPLFLANGGADQRMPQNSVAPWIRSMRALGVRVSAHVQEELGHALDFDADIYAELGRFLHQARRDPDPVTLAWEASAEQLPARHRWFSIEALQPGATRGCVRVTRGRDGGIRMQTEGVAELRVLIEHQSKQAMRLAINPDTEWPQTLRLEAEPSVTTLLRWHAKDAGRDRFFSTEHVVAIAGSGTGLCQSSLAHTLVVETEREQLRASRLQRAEELRAANRSRLERGSGGGLPVDGGSSDAGQPQGDPTRINRPGQRR